MPISNVFHSLVIYLTEKVKSLPICFLFRFPRTKKRLVSPNLQGKQSADSRLQQSSPHPLTRRKSVDIKTGRSPGSRIFALLPPSRTLACSGWRRCQEEELLFYSGGTALAFHQTSLLTSHSQTIACEKQGPVFLPYSNVVLFYDKHLL